MGVYLSQPATETVSDDKCLEYMSYGSSSMQGWRKSQEDAHNCCPSFDPDNKTLLFAVYDGHGGAEVAEYTSRHLPDFIKENKLYKDHKLPDALVESFLEFDASIIGEAAQKELLSIAQLDKVESADENEADKLNEEADMPIEKVMQNYGGLTDLPEHVHNVYESNLKLKGKLTEKLNQKFESPFLRAKGSIEKSDLDAVKMKLDGENHTENPDRSVNGHLDENGNGKCSAVESTSGDSTGFEPSTEPDSGHVSSSTDKYTDLTDTGGGENEATPAAKKEEVEKSKQEPETENKAGCEEASSSNIEDEESHKQNGEAKEEDEDEDEDEDEEEWSDTSDEDDEEDSEEEEGCCDHGDEEMMATFNEEEKPGYDSGCTAVVALIRDRELHVANAGDSRCVLCRAGKAVDLSVDHKPEDDVELARIKKAGGMVSFDGRVNGGLNLSRALGDHCYKTNTSLALKDQMISGLPDIQSTTIQDDDHFIVLACDGIWNSLTSQEVVDFVRERIDKTEKLSKICEELFHTCLAPNTSGDGTGCDNMTAVIVKFHTYKPSAESDDVTNRAGDVTKTTDDVTTSSTAKTQSGVKRTAADSNDDENEADAQTTKRPRISSSDCVDDHHGNEAQSTVGSTG